MKVVIKVTDDVYTKPANVSEIIQNDAVLLAFANRSTNGLDQYLITSLNNQAFVGKYSDYYLSGKIEPAPGLKAHIVHRNGDTWYETEIPKKLLKGNDWYFNVLINDSDWGQRKQYIEWFPGLGQSLISELWYKIVL